MKKHFSVVLAVCMLVATFVFAPAKVAEASSNVTLPVNITVVPAGTIGAERAKLNVDALRAKIPIPNDLDQDFRKHITRAELAALLVNVNEYIIKESLPKGEHSFTDIKGHQYEEALVKAYTAGLINGSSATLMNPDGKVNREQAAVIVCNLLRNVKGVDLRAYYIPEDGKFADNAEISSWAAKSVYYVSGEKIISDMGNNKFYPDMTLSRDNGITLMRELIKKLEG